MEYIYNPTQIFEPTYKIINSHEVIHKIVNNQILYQPASNNVPYYDHFEFTSFYSSCILFYGLEDMHHFHNYFHIVFPGFRKAINDTRGSFSVQIKEPYELLIQEQPIQETLKEIRIKEYLSFLTTYHSIEIKKEFYHSSSSPSLIIQFTFKNKGNEQSHIQLSPVIARLEVKEDTYQNIPYYLHFHVSNNSIILKPHETKKVYFSISCSFEKNPFIIEYKKEYMRRKNLCRILHHKCDVKTDNNVLNTLITFCKLRNAETIFSLKNGLMHSPCGGQYYAAIWNNDQCEYTAPFFGYLNYEVGNKAILNAFDMFHNFMHEYSTPLVCSIIAEGDDYWNGAKDRGDASMYAYGLSYFLLTKGSRSLALRYVDSLKWCIHYTLLQKNEFGVIQSDSDELENRFESGKCNLATNSIFYKALLQCASLMDELNLPNDYLKEATLLKENILRYFYLNDKVIYCKEETHLRSHIVYPLIMGILDHSELITSVILSSQLKTENGLKTIDNDQTYWDRITLMGIRGLFCSNRPEEAYEMLLHYSKERLLCNHVPYAIEAFPEGNQAQLSAENGLYVRIYIEGILGFDPIDFSSFRLHLSMPSSLPYLQVTSLFYGGRKHFIEVISKNAYYEVHIDQNVYKLQNYETLIYTIKKTN